MTSPTPNPHPRSGPAKTKKPPAPTGCSKAPASPRKSASVLPPATPPNHAGDASGRSLDLIAGLRSGQIEGRLLAPEDRQSVVGVLASDGVSSAEIAQILKVSDRTVERDRRALRETLAVSRDPGMVEQMVGRLMQEAEISVQRIRRIARDREAEPALRVDAEHRAFQIVSELVQRLQSVGYLPNATHRIQADLTHHAADLPTVEELQGELVRLRSAGAPIQMVEELQALMNQAAAASGVRELVGMVGDAEANA